MRLSLGYPDPDAERKMLLGEDSRKKLVRLQRVISAAELVAIQQAVDDIHCSDNLLDYIQRLVEHSRTHGEFVQGLSPRGALALLRCAKTWALMAGRGHVVPEDVQMVLPPVVEHRLNGSVEAGQGVRGMAHKLMEEVKVIL